MGLDTARIEDRATKQARDLFRRTKDLAWDDPQVEVIAREYLPAYRAHGYPHSLRAHHEAKTTKPQLLIAWDDTGTIMRIWEDIVETSGRGRRPGILGVPARIGEKEKPVVTLEAGPAYLKSHGHWWWSRSVITDRELRAAGWPKSKTRGRALAGAPRYVGDTWIEGRRCAVFLIHESDYLAQPYSGGAP